jgi:autophagy-related protein 13
VILQSRVSLPIVLSRDQTKKVNKWVSHVSYQCISTSLLTKEQFQLETDDTDAFRDDLSLWKMCGGFENRPPTLILETYLDTKDLTNSQSLVIVDDHGKRWDVIEALNNSTSSNDGSSRHRTRLKEVILERWKIELIGAPKEQPSDFGSILPTIYKKGIVFFRSLYATTKFVPAWRFTRNLARAGKASLRVNCRVINGDEFRTTRRDALTHPLNDSDGPVTTTFSLGEIDSPAGRFSAEVCYRNDCNFRVDDSEALLSSQFMGADEHFFQPSLGTKGDPRRRAAKTVEVGSLPTQRQRLEEPEPTQAYGSLSTFHGDAPPLGSSPISALRAARTMGSEANSPTVGSTREVRPLPTARSSSTRPLEGIAMARRPSTSFQPFKAGSLSASPIPSAPLGQGGDILAPPSPQSYTRNSGISALTQARNRSSLTAGMPASLRGVPIVPENAIASSASASPKPAPINRYSSSFSHRRGKMSLGSSKVDDDQGSSGKQSLSSSSAQPGSGILAEGGAGGSSGSLQTDDDQISDFLKMLDSKKTLQSFEPSRSGDTSAKRTNAQLSRFQSMRDSNNALTESMSSSLHLHRSSSSSSRQLSSVPPMVAATSMSTSSSPGKPVSPHTPHTPAIPSRLSANSIISYPPPRRPGTRNRTAAEAPIDDVSGPESDEAGATAIDIPTSPRPYYPHNRRSSSVAQQHRALPVDEDLGDMPFGIHRSISLGADDREAPSLSALLGIGQVPEAGAGSNSRELILQPAAQISESSAALARQGSASPEHEEASQLPRGLLPGSLNSPYRPRLGRAGGRGATPPQTGSYSSLATDRGSGSGMSDRPGARYSYTRPTGSFEKEDDEPLLFDMSEIGRDQSRRSLEEGRGGGSTGAGATDRASRGEDSGSSSRRGNSRRGWT